MTSKRTTRLIATVAAGLVVFAMNFEAAAGAVWHVDDDAGGGGDGQSWGTAFNDLHDALAVAESGDQIWTAAGVYAPADPGGDRAASFFLNNGVQLYGGFAGDETQLDQRDWQVNLTILDGDLNGDDEPDFLNNGENSHTVVQFSSQAEIGTILDGFVIRGGNADQLSATQSGRGGGIYLAGVTAEIRNCTFESNFADSGGAVALVVSAPVFDNCRFQGNRASGDESFFHSHGSGGAVFAHLNNDPLFINCTFIDNHAPGPTSQSVQSIGGAIASVNSDMTIQSCFFEGNSAGMPGLAGGRGGALAARDTDGAISVISVTDSTFASNTTKTQSGIGGAVYLNSIAQGQFTDCDFLAHQVPDRAGVAWVYACPATFEGCSFQDNTAGGDGGAINILLGELTLSDCDFAGNSGVRGGAVRAEDTEVHIDQCTFTANAAAGEDSLGGAVSIRHGPVSISGTAFTDNTCDETAGGLSIGGVLVSVVVSDCQFTGNQAIDQNGGAAISGDGTIMVSQCVFEGNTSGGDAGGLATSSNDTTVVGCTFQGNTAADTGGGIQLSAGGVTRVGLIRNCDFTQNTANDGGGAYLSGNITALNCQFINNTAWRGGGVLSGGGIDEEFVMRSCIIADNLATSRGGGLAAFDGLYQDCWIGGNVSLGNGGGAWVGNAWRPRFLNSIFTGNHADANGGAIYNDHFLGCILTNCVVSRNTADGSGDGIHDDDEDANPIITNTILWANGGAQYFNQIAHPGKNNVTINYSCVLGWDGSLDGIGNIGCDPLFVDARGEDDVAGTLDDDLRIRADSPCIDEGDNTELDAGVTADFDGLPRFHDDPSIPDGGNPDGKRPIVDMGPFEFQDASTPTVEWVDFSILYGTHQSGGLEEIRTCNDERMVVNSKFGFTAMEPSVADLLLTGVTTNLDAVEIDLIIESFLSQPGTAKIRLRNWSTGGLEQVGSYAIGTFEDDVEIEDVDATDRIRSEDGRIEVSLRHVVVAVFSASGFSMFVDRVTVKTP